MKTTAKPITLRFETVSFPEITIPAGTPVIPADNIPRDENGNQKYWVQMLALSKIPNGSAYEATGILLTKNEVEGGAE